MSYALWMDFAYIPADLKEGGGIDFYKCEIIPHLIMLAVVLASAGAIALLLHTRHQILKGKINEWSVLFVQRHKRFLWIVTGILFLTIFIIATLAWRYVFEPI